MIADMQIEEAGTPAHMFNPSDYIERLESGYVLCTNPVADGGLSAITVNTMLNEERRRHFQDSIKRMVLAKLFSPKFAEVILAASELAAPQLALA